MSYDNYYHYTHALAFQPGSTQLLKISRYACNITYICDVTGNGFTIWSGSAFDDCSGSSSNEIRFSHASFRAESEQFVCNNGAVRGRSLTVNENTYTSELSVMVNSNFIGSTINCTHFHNLNGNNTSETIIGSAVIEDTGTINIL